MSGDNEELERSDPQSQSVYPDTDPEDVTQESTMYLIKISS